MATVSKALEVYNELKNEFNESQTFYAVCFDENGYLNGLPRNAQDLKWFLTNRKPYGVIASETSKGNRGWLLEGTYNVLLRPNSPLDYAFREMLKTPDSDKIDILERKVLSNNHFTYALHEYINGLKRGYAYSEATSCSNHPEIQSGRLPYYRILRVIVGNLEFLVTEHQVSIMTPFGLVDVHNTQRDIDAPELIGMLGWLLNVDDTEQLAEIVYANYVF